MSIILVRHGTTPFLEEGKKKIEGYSEIPLTSEGQKEAEEAGEFLKNKNLHIDSFDSSPLLRGRETAWKIEKALDRSYRLEPKLKTWNPGIFEGRKVENNIHTLNSFIENPHDNVPGTDGSYSDFYKDATSYLKPKIEDDKVHLAVTHNRVITLARALAKNKGKFPDFNMLKDKGIVEPGGVIKINPDWSIEMLKNEEAYENAS